MLSKKFCEYVSTRQLILNGDVDIYENSDILQEWLINVEKFI